MSQQLWEVKIPSSSVSFKLWGLLDTYSELFRGHLHSVSHSTAPVLPGASWERWNREVYVTFQADTKPTLPRTSSGGSGRSVTVQSTFHKGAKQQSTAGPCSIPTAPLLPITADGNRNHFRYNGN